MFCEVFWYLKCCVSKTLLSFSPYNFNGIFLECITLLDCQTALKM